MDIVDFPVAEREALRVLQHRLRKLHQGVVVRRAGGTLAPPNVQALTLLVMQFCRVLEQWRAAGLPDQDRRELGHAVLEALNIRVSGHLE